MSGKNIVWRGPRVRKKLVMQVSRNMDMAAILIETTIKKSFGDSGGGGSYWHDVAGKKITVKYGPSKADRRKNPSKPGDPPNVDTGLLKRAVGFTKPSLLVRYVGTGLGSNAKTGYAKHLEFGTRFMAPRPFLRPAFRKNRRKIQKLLGRKIR